ncbi:MAG: hypothetical protein HY329_13410 [Chloroflexi bacterium]|nr:hypothetical protein [Chloroflexota bacterium]
MTRLLVTQIPARRVAQWHTPLWSCGWHLQYVAGSTITEAPFDATTYTAAVTGDSLVAQTLTAEGLPVVLCAENVTAAAQTWTRRLGRGAVAIVPTGVSGRELCERLRLFSASRGDVRARGRSRPPELSPQMTVASFA